MPRSPFILLLLSAAVYAEDAATEFGGHTKVAVTSRAYPDQSLFRDIVGSSTIDIGGDLRLNLGATRNRWTFDASYQLLTLHGDGIELGRMFPGGTDLLFTGLPSDDRRLFDLTHAIDDDGKTAIVHRIDRLAVSFASEKTVVRIGRQVLSWGNGLFYAPMDLVNPFDPATVDTEYKAGDDMLYLQYLLDSGDDVQVAYVVRRDPETGDVDNAVSTAAAKYHGIKGEAEVDVLLADHYGDTVLGIGLGRSVGGAVLRGDLVTTWTGSDTHLQLVANLSYSWTWSGRNMSGAFEYFFNGFGQRSGAYSPADLDGNGDLVDRIARGELFSIGRHYLAGSILIEMTPLWTLTPTALTNISDPSGLLQLVSSYSLSDNMTLLASINLPLGPKGTEFGGIPSDEPDRFVSGGAGLFAQLAWYF